jgi:hypothetical protein
MRTNVSAFARIHRRPAYEFLVALIWTTLLLVQGCSSPKTAPAVTEQPTHPLVTPAVSPSVTATSTHIAASTTAATPLTPVRGRVIRTVLPSQTPTPIRTATASAVSSSTPSVPARVEVQRRRDRFILLVNGQPTIVRGMNYNVNYTQLPTDEQLKLHRRDFQILRDAGVNVVIGWGIYNEVTLQVAQEFGIGVIMPFELDSEGAYENEGYKEQIKSDFSNYVKRYRDFPAVWGWNPGGDELLYRMQNEEYRTVDKLQMAADLELELIALSHSLDPHHINVLKEPRDWYIKYLAAALQSVKNQPAYLNLTSYLVYGVNVYGRYDDITLALTNAKLTLDSQLGLAMMVSEFGPFNSPRADRPADYAIIWNIVSQISSIGGCAYVFGPDQPNPAVSNPYDPLTLLPSEYSMVDMNGTPVDDSLAGLAAKWHLSSTPTPYPSGTPEVK